jgi:hypothetical protein
MLGEICITPIAKLTTSSCFSKEGVIIPVYGEGLPPGEI